MEPTNNNAPELADSKGAKNTSIKCNHSNRLIKRKRVLGALLAGGSYNRFEAEQELSDHCLNSTIAELGTFAGINISRCWEVVPGYLGAPTRCKRYWIEPEEIARVQGGA